MALIGFQRFALAALLVFAGGAAPVAFAQDRSAQAETDNSDAETVEAPTRQPELVLRIDDTVPQPGQRLPAYDTDTDTDGDSVPLRRIENRIDLRLETRLDTRLDRRAYLPRTEPDREENSGELSRSTSGYIPEGQ